MQTGYWTVTCIVLWILKPYPVTSCSPLHKAGGKDGKFEGNYCTVCYALYVQSQKVTRAHDCTEPSGAGRKGAKKKEKRPVRNHLLSVEGSLWVCHLCGQRASWTICSVLLPYFAWHRVRFVFQRSCSNRQRLVSLGHSSQSCLAPCWSCLKQTLATISQSFVLLSLSIQGLENAMWTEVIIYACSSPDPGAAGQTLTPPAQTPSVAWSFLRHPEARGTPVAPRVQKMETGFAQAWMCWQEPLKSVTKTTWSPLTTIPGLVF